MVRMFAGLVIMILLLMPSLLLAAEQEGAPGMVIRADHMSYQEESDLLTATGAVQITWQEMLLTADQATYNRISKIMTAQGNVVMIKSGDRMQGDNLLLDTETGRAEMENGHIFMEKNNVHLDGKQVARMDDDQYALKSGNLTTCDAAVPSWKFKADDLDVTVEDYATGSNVIFYIKDVPVFYFPYIVLPVKRERQSGLLFPRFGKSTKRGGFLELPVYWAISPSQEATFTLDIQTKRGVGLGTDYRYLRSRTSEGFLSGYAIHDNNENKARGQLIQFHKEQLPNNLSLITSVNITSDHTYLHDYGDKSGEYNRQYYDSRVVLAKHWDSWMTGAQAIYTQDFYTGSNSRTLQRAPELFLHGVRQAVPYIPALWFDMDMLLTNYYREKGMKGQRTTMTPRLSTSNSLFGGRLNASVYGGAQIRAYNTTEAAAGIDEKSLVAIPEFGAELSSSLSRVYDGPFMGMSSLRHELVPSISYSYSVNEDQTSYPQYDQNDRLPHLNLLQFSIASHLGGKVQRVEGQKGPDSYRYLQTIRLSQGYSISGERSRLLSDTTDTGRPWSNTVIESETWLHPGFRLLLDAAYNPYRRRFSSTALGGDILDGMGNSLGASYRMTRQQVEYLEGRVTLAMLKPVYLSYSSRYSFDKQDFLEHYATVEYRHQCWGIMATWHERPDEKSWTINFNLAGLFNIGTGPAARIAR